MKYKVGDKVRIKDIDWYNENKDEYGNVPLVDFTKSNYNFNKRMRGLCGKVVTISRANKYSYDMVEDNGVDFWTDEMIEGLVEEETKPKLKFKVGDKVRIKSLDWYNKNKTVFEGTYFVSCDCGRGSFTDNMVKYCGEIVTIASVDPYYGCYFIKEDKECWLWTDEMIECKGEEEVGLVDNLSCRWVNEFNLPDGYIFKDENGNVINATKIVLEKKKKEYPKTYEECCVALEYIPHTDDIIGYKWNILQSLQKLLICRDAYWKIAGEEMGLNRPWEPDYDSGVNKYGIICLNGVVQESNPTTNWERHLNKVLDFPTREMRDAFYKNFKELIEQCKELL